MASKVSIANQALSWLGADSIAAFTDATVGASLITVNYDGVRDAVLAEHSWTFATRRVVLSPLLTPPDFGYSHAFKLPPGTLRVISVRDDGRNGGPSGVEYVREGGDLLSNSAVLYVTYIKSIDDPLQYSPNFVQAFASRLAADLAIPLTGSKSLQREMYQLYLAKLANAATLDGMQGRAQRTGSRKWVTVRGASGSGNVLGPNV